MDNPEQCGSTDMPSTAAAETVEPAEQHPPVAAADVVPEKPVRRHRIRRLRKSQRRNKTAADDKCAARTSTDAGKVERDDGATCDALAASVVPGAMVGATAATCISWADLMARGGTSAVANDNDDPADDPADVPSDGPAYYDPADDPATTLASVDDPAPTAEQRPDRALDDCCPDVAVQDGDGGVANTAPVPEQPTTPFPPGPVADDGVTSDRRGVGAVGRISRWVGRSAWSVGRYAFCWRNAA